jgi:hypothetical protein
MEKSLVVVENVKTVGFIMGLVMRAGKVFIKNFTAEEGGIAINYGSHAFLNGTNNAVFMTVDSGKVTQQESGTTTINSLDIKNGSDWVVVTKGENILKNTSLKISSSVVTLDSYEQQGGEANVNTGSALTVNELTLGQSTLNINSGSQINVVSSFKATDASLLVSQNSHASLNSGDGTTGTSLDVAMNASVNIVNVPLSAVEATTGSVLDIEGDGSVDMSAMTGVCSRGGRIYTSGVTLASLTDCP